METKAEGYEDPVYHLNGEEVTGQNGNGVSGTLAGGTEPNVTIVNRKDTQIDTGIFTSNLPYFLVLAGIAAAAVVFFMSKKRRADKA